jgi:hypothetical protein
LQSIYLCTKFLAIHDFFFEVPYKKKLGWFSSKKEIIPFLICCLKVLPFLAKKEAVKWRLALLGTCLLPILQQKVFA